MTKNKHPSQLMLIVCVFVRACVKWQLGHFYDLLNQDGPIAARKVEAKSASAPPLLKINTRDAHQRAVCADALLELICYGMRNWVRTLN
jgi:hypothetical protein